MMRLRSFAALLTAVAGLGLIGMAQPAHAASISNFNQNPRYPTTPATFSVVGTNFTGTNIPIDYTFLTAPGNTGAYTSSAPLATVGANLNITSGGLVGTATTGLGGSLQQAVDFNFAITVRGGANNNNPATAPAGTNLLTGRLTGVLNVSAGGNTATMVLSGLSWTSGVMYDVGGGAQMAQQLGGYSASWALTGISPGATISGGNIVGIGTVEQLNGGFVATPEPASMILLGLGLAAVPALALVRRRVAKV